MNLAETTAAVLMVCVGAFLLSLIVGLCKDTFFSTNKKSGIRVIKKGEIPTQKVECLHCHSIVEYDRMAMDYTVLQPENYWFVICPVCGMTIEIEEWEGGEE